MSFPGRAVVLAWLCAGVLVTSATTKVFVANERSTGPTLVAPHTVASYAVASLELVLASSLILKRYRLAAAVGASAFLLVGAGYLLLRITLGLPECGCFGGRLRMSVWLHLALVGGLLCALSVVIAASGRRGSKTDEQGVSSCARG